MDKEVFFTSLQLEQKNNHDSSPSSLQSQTTTDRPLTENKMGKCRNCDNIEACKTKQLTKWIRKVQRKKSYFRKNRQRNLRIEAVLAHALFNAEYKLRAKELLRISKLQGKSNIYYNENQNYSDFIQKTNNIKQEPLCPELSSLDDFMKQICEVKISLQR